ncbi:MAG: NAD(+)/NADH kinase [Burkholderiaceae bacterium]|jgi:NAD+ kinase
MSFTLRKKSIFMTAAIDPLFHTLALFGKHTSSNEPPYWVEVARYLRALGCNLLIAEDSAAGVKEHGFQSASLDRIRKTASTAVVVGGDGTFLGVARHLAGHGIPLIGINQGRLGFMTDIAFDEHEARLSEIIGGDYFTENRAHLCADIVRGDKTLHTSNALNDVVITRGMIGGMIDIRVSVDQKFMYDLRADALIVSSPTGSTAYALSAQGPILHPKLEGIVIVPVAPHALTNRPIALPQSCEIEIFVQGGRETFVHFDMQSNAQTRVGDCIRIRVDPTPIQLIHPLHYDYFSVLRQKLHWSATPGDWSGQKRGLRGT